MHFRFTSGVGWEMAEKATPSEEQIPNGIALPAEPSPPKVPDNIDFMIVENQADNNVTYSQATTIAGNCSDNLEAPCTEKEGQEIVILSSECEAHEREEIQILHSQERARIIIMGTAHQSPLEDVHISPLTNIPDDDFSFLTPASYNFQK